MKLVCPVGSRYETEETKLLVLDFDPDSKWKILERVLVHDRAVIFVCDWFGSLIVSSNRCLMLLTELLVANNQIKCLMKQLICP